MLKSWAPDDVRESGEKLPAGIYKFRIESFETKMSSTKKAMIIGNLRVVEPKQFKNLPFPEYFVVGTEDDPHCDDPATWSATVGASRFKTMLKKAGVRLISDVPKQFKVAAGAEFLASVTQEIETKGQYKGRVSNRLAAFFALGERKAGLADDEEEDKPKPKVAARPAEVEEEEEEEVEEEAEEEDEAEEEEEEDDPPVERRRSK